MNFLGFLLLLVITIVLGEQNNGTMNGTILRNLFNTAKPLSGTRLVFGERLFETKQEVPDLGLWSHEDQTMLVQLVCFMVNHEQPSLIHLLHDRSVYDMSSIVRAINTLGRDVTVSTYKNGSGFLDIIMRTHHHSEIKRKVVVICSSDNTLEIFKHQLVSSEIQWIVILLQDVVSELAMSVEEGTQVTVALRDSTRHYQFLSSYVDKENVISFKRIGYWSWSPQRGPTWFLQSPLTPDLEKEYSDFGGRVLKGAVVPNWPFFKVTPLEAFDGPYQEAIPHSGIDANVINVIAQKLNFSYKLLLSDSWGGPQPDGSVSGIIGMVARREAHFAIDELTITRARESVVDFSIPYFLESTTLLTPFPSKRNRVGAVFSPFTPKVWSALIISILLISPVLSLISKLMRTYVAAKRAYSTSQFGFLLFRSLLLQGDIIRLASWPHRFVFCSWYLFTFCVCAFYSGTLTAVLITPSYEDPIDSLWDLLKATKEKGFRPLLTLETTTDHILKEATLGIYEDLWNSFDPNTGYVSNLDEGVSKVLTGNYAFINAWLSTEIRINKIGRRKFYIARQTFYPQSYGVALRPGAPYKRILDRKLLQLVESGLVSKWTRDEVRKVAEDSPDEGHHEEGVPAAISLTHLQAAFYVLGAGFLVASLTLAAEVFWCRTRL